MGTMLSITYGLGLEVPEGALEAWYERTYDEEYEGDPFDAAEELLRDYSELSYDMAYYYDYGESEVAIFIDETTQTFYGAHVHDVEHGAYTPERVADGLMQQLEAVAKVLDIPFEPKWRLAVSLG